MNPEDNIDHFVVLMLENRSFDCLLGQLYPRSDDFDGLSLDESNQAPDGRVVKVWNKSGDDRRTMSTPAPDPGELWTDMNTQLFGEAHPATGAAADMSGFVQSYLEQAQHGQSIGASYSDEAVMHYFSAEQVPVMSRLARAFAVCDRWFASAPCQTWPNRFFLHTATAGGYENNSPVHFPYLMKTVFTRFNDAGQDSAWKIYFHDVPQSVTLTDLWPHVDHFRLYDEFREDAKAGTLPFYSFIEPRYFADLSLPNDAHPPHVVTLAEQLVADVYNQLRSAPQWTKTLLIITCDEHGGCYDHVPPPAAVPPDGGSGGPFGFDRYGVRVPAILVSPFIREGTILRPPADGPPFDHTSIIASLRKRFRFGPALTQRDAQAPDVFGVLNLAEPSNLGPESVQALRYTPSPGEVARARQAPPNDMQRALHALSALLPDLASSTDGIEDTIQSHLQKLPELVEQYAQSTLPDTLGSVLQDIKHSLGRVFP